MKRKLLNVFLRIIHFLPVIDIILFESFLGKRIDENIIYIMKNFKKKRKYLVYEKGVDFSDEIAGIPNLKLIKRRSVRFYIYQNLAKYIITNSRLHSRIKAKKKSQTVIQLWHGIPWKKLAFDQDNISFSHQSKEEYLEKFAQDVLKWDYLWVPSKWAGERFASAFTYKGKRIEAMYPSDVELVKMNKPNLFQNMKYSKTVLYMPTFREEIFISKGKYGFYENFDFNDFASKHKDVLFLVRTHYLVSEQINHTLDNVVDVSNYKLLNDLYSYSDVLLTDYSSALYNFSLLKKPIIALNFDVEQYSKTRGLYDFAVDNMDLTVLKSIDEIDSIDFNNLNNSKTNQDYYTENYIDELEKIIK